MLLTLTASSLAATLIVDPSDSSAYGSISSALTAASDGDTVKVVAGTYSACVDLLGKTVTLESVKGSGSTTLDGGAIVALDATLDLVDCELSGNSADLGGHLYAESSLVTLTTSSFSTGWADSYGGAIYSSGSSLELDRVSFTDNEADTRGGALYLDDGDSLVTDGCSFDSNLATNDGGAVFLGKSATWVGDTDSFDSDQTRTGSSTTRGYGGAFFADEGATVDLVDASFELSGSSIYYSRAGSDGGGVWAEDPVSVSIASTDFERCSADASSRESGGAPST